MMREVYCRIVVMACGEDLSGKAQALREGEAVRIGGFLSQRRFSNAETRLVLHAQRIDSGVAADAAAGR